MKSVYNFFLAEEAKIFKKNQTELNSRIQKARKEYAIHSDIITELNNKASDIERELDQKSIDRFFREMEKDCNLDSQLTPESAFLNCCIRFNIMNDKTAITLLAQYKSNESLQSFYREDLQKKSLKELPQGEQIGHYNNNYWLGQNETEIIQLFYALIECGRLEKKGKIKMVESIADFLGFKLTDDWNSKLSHAVHRSNDDTKPSVFDEMKNGWEIYKNKLITELQSKR